MENTEINALLKRLKELSFENLCDEIENYSIETLELLAKKLYDESLFKKHDILVYTILSERSARLDNNFEWNNENRQKFLTVNDKFMQVFEAAYNEALAAVDELEDRIKNNDKFIKDYEIKIKITAYMHDRFYDDDLNNFGFVLSEPEPDITLKYSFGHSNFRDEQKERPIYLDKSYNWNIEYFGDNFKDDYICYQIHELLDNHWTFYDIININRIWADVEIIHQHYQEVVA